VFFGPFLFIFCTVFQLPMHTNKVSLPLTMFFEITKYKHDAMNN